ncbi:hypothetical protein PM033_17300 [Halorubrum ezzemoulense]|nr:hypothetical protein [Halorubrum ezzemoulense]
MKPQGADRIGLRDTECIFIIMGKPRYEYQSVPNHPNSTFDIFKTILNNSLLFSTLIMSYDGLSDAESLQNIHENWYDGTGPCEGCPKRDGDHVTSPHFGFSNHPSSADVVILGESPGGKGSKAPASDDGMRVWKNYTDVGDEVPKEFENSRDDFSVGQLNRDSCGNYGDWEIFHKALDIAWKELAGHNRDIQIYYTNHTKCSDIHINGYEHNHTDCDQYLVPELEVWNPDGIIAFHGPRNHGNHLHDVLHELDVPDVPDNDVDRRELIYNNDQNQPFKKFQSGVLDATVICSYHWQQDIGNASTDWQAFADEHGLSEEIIKPESGFKRRYATTLAETLINEIGWLC